MIDLNDENDPMLFAVTLPNGRLIVQYMEVVATIQGMVANGSDPGIPEVCRAIRDMSRTPEVAKGASDAVLTAAWARMTQAVNSAGNG
jgi:hypothetical protein